MGKVGLRWYTLMGVLSVLKSTPIATHVVVWIYECTVCVPVLHFLLCCL